MLVKAWRGGAVDDPTRNCRIPVKYRVNGLRNNSTRDDTVTRLSYFVYKKAIVRKSERTSVVQRILGWISSSTAAANYRIAMVKDTIELRHPNILPIVGEFWILKLGSAGLNRSRYEFYILDHKVAEVGQIPTIRRRHA